VPPQPRSPPQPRLRGDLAYIDGWSLALDIKILLRTIPAVFVRTGR
jgi:lipopolysaccharide/colanic/teichoic acid biosynthesis glycosyltransferase